MRIGLITGSGNHALPGIEAEGTRTVKTPFGTVELTEGVFAGVQVAQLSRHGAGHARLSSAVNHRANVWALREVGVGAVIGLTACGAVDADLELGSLVIFDDLHFLSNRLPDGTLCTYFDKPGDPQRGHWVLHGGPFSQELVSLLTTAALDAGLDFQSGGVYGHVDGPRFNTPVEIAALAACGVAAVSQTGGPETVLCGELELPFALVGFITDHANGVIAGEPTPVQTLLALIERSGEVFSRLLREALPAVAAAPTPPSAAGTLIRLGAPEHER